MLLFSNPTPLRKLLREFEKGLRCMRKIRILSMHYMKLSFELEFFDRQRFQLSPCNLVFGCKAWHKCDTDSLFHETLYRLQRRQFDSYREFGSEL